MRKNTQKIDERKKKRIESKAVEKKTHTVHSSFSIESDVMCVYEC